MVFLNKYSWRIGLLQFLVVLCLESDLPQCSDIRLGWSFQCGSCSSHMAWSSVRLPLPSPPHHAHWILEPSQRLLNRSSQIISVTGEHLSQEAFTKSALPFTIKSNQQKLFPAVSGIPACYPSQRYITFLRSSAVLSLFLITVPCKNASCTFGCLQTLHRSPPSYKRIREWSGLERTLKDHLIPPPCHGQGQKQ